MPAAKPVKTTTKESAAKAGAVWPDARGRFGRYGGRYVPETLIPALDDLTAAYTATQTDKAFQKQFRDLLRDFVEAAFAVALIEQVLPDVLVKGADYALENVVGREVVEARGGRVVLIPLSPGYSTTALLELLRR